MNPALFPTASRYLDRLPGGLAAYSDVTTKASLYRDALDVHPLLSVARELPPVLRALVERPVPVSDWIPEVQWQALMLVLRDVYFPGAQGDERYQQFALARNRRLLSTPLYRVLFLVVSPERLLTGVQHRWEAFHRGSPLEFVARAPGCVALRLSFRPQLFDPCVLGGIATAFRASVEAANGRNTQATVDEVRPTSALFTVQWT